MVTLTRIDSSIFGKLYDAFLHDDDPYSSEQDWRNVFDYQWHTDEGHCGYAMMDDGVVVGMMGMVFSAAQSSLVPVSPPCPGRPR